MAGKGKRLLWLDDNRDPQKHGAIGFDWAKTAEEAIAALKTGEVEFASLDHDLAWEHYPAAGVPPSQYKEQTGYAVIEWLRENGGWPTKGMRVHSLNPVGRVRMQIAIDEHYKTPWNCPCPDCRGTRIPLK